MMLHVHIVIQFWLEKATSQAIHNVLAIHNLSTQQKMD